MYLSDRTLAKRYDLSRSTIWRWSAEGIMPMPVKINGSTRWRKSDIEQWEKDQEYKVSKEDMRSFVKNSGSQK